LKLSKGGYLKKTTKARIDNRKRGGRIFLAASATHVKLRKSEKRPVLPTQGRGELEKEN